MQDVAKKIPWILYYVSKVWLIRIEEATDLFRVANMNFRPITEPFNVR